MELFESILLILAAVLLSSIIDQIIPRVSAPLIQIGLGLLMAFFALAPLKITIDPELFLVLFIAPLLFYEAKEADKKALWVNRGRVLSLAIGLVIATTLIVGFYMNWLIPSIPLAAAFALGAALAPTDAVAVVSISKEANLTKSQKNTLGSEALLNDASGVVSFQFALAAAITGTFSLLDASVSFFITFIGGALIGIVLAYLTNFLVKKARDLGVENTTFHVLFEVCLPFIVFIVAEVFHVSGIIAVVAAGLIVSLTPNKMGPSMSRHNIVSTSVWKVLSFTLNGIVFVLLGALLPGAMESAWESSQTDNFIAILEVFILVLMIYLIRFSWLFGLDFIERRKDNHRKFTKENLRDVTVTTLAGAKGAITLSIVMTIPFFFIAGDDLIAFPQRDLILFLASGVIITTLLVATFVVPLLAPKKEDAMQSEQDEKDTIIELLRKVVEELRTRQEPNNRIATQSVIRSYNERIARLKETNDSEVEQNKELRIKAIRMEQDYILELIDNDELDYLDGYQQLNRLARTQNLIQHHTDNSWMLRILVKRLVRYIKNAIHHFRTRKSPDQEIALHTVQLRRAQEKIAEHVLCELQKMLDEPSAPKEGISRLIYEYQHVLNQLRNPRPSVSSIADNAKKVAEITRLGLGLELNEIQSMYESERLSRAVAKRLRENVYLMQVDLEEHIY